MVVKTGTDVIEDELEVGAHGAVGLSEPGEMVVWGSSNYRMYQLLLQAGGRGRTWERGRS
jgi:hypothetical protein